MKKNLILMYIIALLQGMVFYGPISTLYRQVHGLTVFDITLIESISMGLSVILEIPWGIVADRIGYRKTMIFCCAFYFVSKIIFWQATTFQAFLLERILLSIVIAGMSGVDMSILYLSSNPQDSQKVFGMYDAMGMTGLLIATVVYSVFIGHDYALSAFLTMVSYGIAALCALGLQEVKKDEKRQTTRHDFKLLLKETVANRQLLVLILAMGLLFETHQTVTVFLNQPKYIECGLSVMWIGWIYLISTAVGILGMFSLLVTRHLRNWMTIGFVGGGYVLACLMLSMTKNQIVAVGSILLLRLAHTIFQPYLRKMENQMIRSSKRATALSVNAMLMDGIAIITNLLFGFLSDISLNMAFAFGVCISLLGVILLLIVSKEKDPQQDLLEV